MFKAILIVVMAVFGVFSTWVMWQVGYMGILMSFTLGVGAAQVFADLVIACCLIMCWIWRDAKQSGRNAWPYLIITLAAGSFGILASLLLKPSLERQITSPQN